MDDNYSYPVALLFGNIHGRSIDSKGCPMKTGLGMRQNCTEAIEQDVGWWIGWIEEISDGNCQESTREALIESLPVTLGTGR